MGEYLGVNRRTIWSWETGNVIPKRGDIQMMAQLLNIDIRAISDIEEFEESKDADYKHFIFEKHVNDMHKWIEELKQNPNANIASLVEQ